MENTVASSVPEYLASLPPERRQAMEAVRAVIRANLPPGIEEGMQFGMIGYYVPLSTYPDTYNGQPLCVAALASQKQYMSAYLMAVYGDPATEKWFKAEWKKTGKKLDMGKSCVRFKAVDELPLELVGRVIARVTVPAFIARYEAVKKKPAKARKAATGKPAAKARKPAAKPKRRR
jgi:uncharacterized protein YdhG (YjbR/CyaY superfamily)